MPASTRLARHDDGRAVLEKRGPPARRRHEAEVLRRVAGPGVVELVDATDDAVVLRYVAGPTAVTGIAPDRLATVAASVAATIADAHDRGVVHGRLTADHVIVPAGGAPVVCGWADATVGSPAGGPRPSDDVAAFGRLLLEVGGDAIDGAVRAVADRATAADLDARPSMRALAAALAPAPAPLRPRRATPGRQPPPARRWPRPHLPATWSALAGRRRAAVAAVVAVVAVAAVAVGLAAAVVATRGGEGDRTPAVPTAVPAPPTTRAPAASTTAPPAARATRVWPPDDPPLVVEGGGGRWTVGRAGDIVAVADWDCDGADEPALLRPATGEVWVFEAWEDGVRGVPAGRHPGATGLTADDPDGDGCPTLRPVTG